MSETRNIDELLRLGFESFQREGPEALTALLSIADPEIELYGGPGTEPSGWFRGHEAAVRWSEEWFEAWEEFHMEPTEFIEISDELIVVPLHQVARGKSSGAEVEVDTAFLFEIREGRVARFHVYADNDQALAAAKRLARET